jgi:hypothetical protein
VPQRPRDFIVELLKALQLILGIAEVTLQSINYLAAGTVAACAKPLNAADIHATVSH